MASPQPTTCAQLLIQNVQLQILDGENEEVEFVIIGVSVRLPASAPDRTSSIKRYLQGRSNRGFNFPYREAFLTTKRRTR
ncbi:hypothetical protein GmHk_19G054465 [Glycine max]|nr:hypothetical protein GmHk_19G054465 [Glycine max]